MLVVWVATATAMAMQPGAGRVIAAISALAVAAFIALLVLGVQIGATSAIVNVAAFVILGVAWFEMGAGGNSGGGRRLNSDPPPVEVSGGNLGMGVGGMARGARVLSGDRGRLN
jgi:hypothetical protein